jgi:uncharacterized protein (TIGR03000 family)
MLHRLLSHTRTLTAATILWCSSAALAWELGGPLYAPRWDVPPSHYGYNLDITNPGYYGGGSYREFYNYGRGYGFSNYPGPMPSPIGDPRRYRPVPPPYWLAPPPPPVVDPSAYLIVRVPANAEVWLEGRPTKQTGEERLFVSPPLEANARFAYEVRARWTENGTVVNEIREVVVRSGERQMIIFLPAKPKAPPSDDELPAPRLLPKDIDD